MARFGIGRWLAGPRLAGPRLAGLLFAGRGLTGLRFAGPRFVGLGLAGLALLALSTPLWADSQARIVRLSNVQGNVQIDRRTGDGFEVALENLPVLQGTRIATKDDGRVEIEFEDGSTVRLAPNTSVEFTRLSLRDSGGKNTELEVSEGTAYFNINPGKHDDFVVDVGHRSVNLDHAARFRATVDQSHAHIEIGRAHV